MTIIRLGQPAEAKTRACAMVVEDDVMILLAMVADLEEAGYRTVPASTRHAAEDILRSHPDIAILLTDIRMREEDDGVKLAQYSRRTRPHLPIIAVTGTTGGLPVDLFDAILEKPVAPRALIKAVERALSESPAPCPHADYAAATHESRRP